MTGLDETLETYDPGFDGAAFGAGNGTKAIIDVAIAAAEPTCLDPDGARRFTAHTIPDGASLAVVDREVLLERFRDTPRRKTGTYDVHDADSFAAYFLKHADVDTEVWADVTSTRITAVLDAHDVAGPRWEQHRVEYRARRTEEWAAWVSRNGKFVPQGEFTEFIEQRLLDIVAPASADMLEIVQTIEQNSSVNFRSSKLINNGQRQIEYRETIDGGAGRDGQFEIPKELILGIRPFEGSDPFRVTAAFRTRIQQGQLFLGYQLIRPTDVEREAFTSVVQNIQSQIVAGDAVTSPYVGPILMGSAPAPGEPGNANPFATLG